jgi:NAD(P)-dependent dehydrogenase (short-subunit alcohol dehydrogenase family)
MRLNNKIAVVTGANGSIGAAICQRFIAEGAVVAGIDLIEPSVAKINIQCDLSDGNSLSNAAEKIIDSLGYPSIVIHCAAMSELAETEQVQVESFLKIMSVNVFSAMQLTQLFAPNMKKENNGSFVFISSITGVVGAPGMAAYAASKGALNTATRTLALELADYGVRVNNICPASIDTPMLRGKFSQQKDPEQARRNNINRHPLGRLGTPQDVANYALFLASEEASWVTGTTSLLDGGASIARR